MTLDSSTRGTKNALTEDSTRYARLVGRNIARLRARRGLTQKQLAEELQQQGHSLSAGTIGFIEKGHSGNSPKHQRRNVSVDQLMIFARFFDCNPADLLSETCPHCKGTPPDGFTCNACGEGEAGPQP